MHTLWVRLNAVVFFGLSALLGFSCLAALSKFNHSAKPVVKTLKLNKLKSLKPHGGVDRALLSFDLNVDLNPAFHWNIHQIFLYVVALYETDDRQKNQVVLWDKIVQAGDDANKVIDETNIFVKYALVDQGQKLRGNLIRLQLQWDKMPITGLISMDRQPLAETTTFTLPLDYK